MSTEVTKILDQKLAEVKDERLQILYELRWVSQTTGVVHPQQVKWLTLLANLMFEDAQAIISIDTNSSFVKVESDGSSTTLTEKFPEAIKFIIGDGWTVQMCYNVKRQPSKTRRKRNIIKPERTKRARKAPSKSRG